MLGIQRGLINDRKLKEKKHPNVSNLMRKVSAFDLLRPNPITKKYGVGDLSNDLQNNTVRSF